MADFIFRIQPNIVLGSYTSSRLGQFTKDYGSRFMVIIDPILNELGTAEKIIQSLADRKIEHFVFDEIPEGADTQVLENALQLARQAHIHGVIAAGGSKILNLAKAICSVYHEAHDLYDFLDGATPTCGALPLLCVPTTIRDLFMFTDRTPVIDARSNQIKLLKSQAGICKLILFDPNLTVTLTDNQTAAMSLETLCIAVEAYLSQKSNFFSDMIIEKAVELMCYALDGSPTLTVTTPQETLLSQAGCMTSLGVASSSMGTASLLSLCINARYKISRSLTTVILFPYFIEDAAKYKSERLAKLARILRVATDATPADEAVLAFTEYVRQHIAKANLPARLKELSISIEQLALVAEDAGNLELINQLPRSMNADDLFDLIKQAY